MASDQTDDDAESDSAQDAAGWAARLESMRDYLTVLAESQLDPILRRRVEGADLVQQTMLQAHRARGSFAGTSDAQLAAWLRSILAQVLNRTARDERREKRDATKERSFDQLLDRSSHRLESLLVSPSTSPVGRAVRHEQAQKVASAILRLTPDQREAVLMKYWHERTLAEIAAETGKSPEAVAGLLFRALRALRGEGALTE